MALLQVEFFSNVLGKAVSMSVILPQTAAGQIGVGAKERDTTYPTLYLLHGMTDNHTAWTRYTSIERYAREKGIAVVMPNADLSFYTDMAHGGRYLTYIGEELPAVCRDFFPRMSDKREETFIGGLSMGGYGATKVALTYPETFSHAISLSGVMDIGRFAAECGNQVAMEADFGDVSAVAGSDHDLYVIAERLAKSGRELPKLFFWCGTEDFLYYAHEKAIVEFPKMGYDLTHSTSTGVHSWLWWDKHIQDALDWLPL